MLTDWALVPGMVVRYVPPSGQPQVHDPNGILWSVSDGVVRLSWAVNLSIRPMGEIWARNSKTLDLVCDKCGCILAQHGNKDNKCLFGPGYFGAVMDLEWLRRIKK